MGATKQKRGGPIFSTFPQLIEILVRLIWGQGSPELCFNQNALVAFVVEGGKVRACPLFVGYLGHYSVYGTNIRPSESHCLLQRAAGSLRIRQDMPQRFYGNIFYAISEPRRNMSK